MSSTIEVLENIIDNVQASDGTVALPSYSFQNDLANGMYRIGSNNYAFSSNGVKIFEIKTTGIVVVGSIGIGQTNQTNAFEVAGTSGLVSQMSAFSADALAQSIVFAKSRSATLNTHTIVQAADVLGSITWKGSNGTSFDNAAQIRAIIDAAPNSVNDMPGSIILSTTPDASSTLVDQLVLTNDGRLYAKSIHNNAGAQTGTTNQYIASGTYTPAFTVGTNVDSGSCAQCQWIRVGNVVMVTGQVTVNLTTTLLVSDAGIAFPIAATLTP